MGAAVTTFHNIPHFDPLWVKCHVLIIQTSLSASFESVFKSSIKTLCRSCGSASLMLWHLPNTLRETLTRPVSPQAQKFEVQKMIKSDFYHLHMKTTFLLQKSYFSLKKYFHLIFNSYSPLMDVVDLLLRGHLNSMFASIIWWTEKLCETIKSRIRRFYGFGGTLMALSVKDHHTLTF